MAKSSASVFISYAHSEEGNRYLELCKQAVQAQLAHPNIDLWSDERINSGDDWQKKIEKALSEAAAAILLIDWKFVNSSYIANRELPGLLPAAIGAKAFADGDSASMRIPVIPILIEECPYDSEGRWPGLNRLQMEPEHSMRTKLDPGRKRFTEMITLNELTPQESTKFRNALYRRLKDALRQYNSLTAEIQSVDKNPNLDIDTTSKDAVDKTGAVTEINEGALNAPLFTRYLSNGDDLCRDYVDLQINLAHSEFSTYRLDVRRGVKEGTRCESTVWSGLVELHAIPDKAAENPLDQLVQAGVTEQSADAEERVETVSTVLTAARIRAERMGLPMQLHIGINANAGELHEIAWERLPLDEGGFAANDERILFSRCVLSAGDQAVEGQTGTLHQLRALVAYSDFGIDADGGANPGLQVPALENMSEAVQGLGSDVLVQSLLRPSPDELLDHLSVTMPRDVLYLACEARREGTEYFLRLGKGDLSRNMLIKHFRRAPVPRLVILISTHQVDSKYCDLDSDNALSHFAAQFARLGAGAVVTCQQCMEPASWNRFLGQFFDALVSHGHVSGAIAQGRRDLGDDWWYPVLFGRIKTTRLWYRPGFVSNDAPDNCWASLVTSLQEGRFCPVVGPGIHHRLCQSRTELAREMADEYDYPLSFSHRINLPAVAQYARTLEKRPVFIKKFENKIRRRLCELIDAPDDSRQSLHALAVKVSEVALSAEPDNPYNVLARLPIGLYLTTTLDPFIEVALMRAQESGNRVYGNSIQEVDVFDFSMVDPDVSDMSIRGVLPSSSFEATHPVLVQLYGSYAQLDRAAIAEDDYFQFLATFDRRMQDDKGALRGRLRSSDLVFLGFKWNSLDFRVLFRALQKYANPRTDEAFHIAVQIDPDDDETLHPDKVLEYLRRYFEGGRYLQQAHFSIFWGSATDFLRELDKRIQRVSASRIAV